MKTELILAALCEKVLKCHITIDWGSIGQLFMGGSEGIYQSKFFCFFIQIYHGIFNISGIESFLSSGGPLEDRMSSLDR